MAKASVDILINAEDNASKTLSNVGSASQGLKDGLEKVAKAALAAGAALGAAAVVIGVKSVKAYNEALEVNTKLETLILNQTGATLENVEALKDQANALAGVGIVSDDAIVSAQAQLATFDLTSDTIQKLIPGLLDMTVAEKGVNLTTQDLKDAAQGLGKAFVGQTDALVKQGFTFTEVQKQILETGTAEEKLAVITDAMGKTYGGMNEEMRDTFPMIAAKNAIDELQEGIGELISEYLNPVIDSFNDWMTSMGGAEGIMDKVKSKVDALKSFIIELADSVGISLESWDDFKESFSAAIREFDAKTGVITAIKDELTKLWDKIKNDLVPAIMENKDAITDFAKIVGTVVVVAVLGLIKGAQLLIDILTFLVETDKKLRDFFHNFIEDIKNLKNFFTDIGGAITAFKDLLIQEISIAIPKAIAYFELFKATVEAKLTVMAQQAVAWGANIIQGIIDGISNKYNEAIAYISSIASGIATTFSNVLQIRSPSQIFREFGEFIMEGLMIGLEDGDEDLKSKIENIGEAFVTLKEKGKDAWKTFKDSVNDAKSSYNEAMSDIREQIGSLKDEMGLVKDQFKLDLQEIKDDFNNSYAELSGNFETDVANEILSSEERLAEARSDLADEQAQAAEDQNADTIADLQATIDAETAFLEAHTQDYITFADAITEARRVASLDSIQLLQEQFEAEKELLKSDQADKEKALHDEKEATLLALNDQLIAYKNEKEQEKIILKDALADARKALKNSYDSIKEDTVELVDLLKNLFGGIPESITESFDTLVKRLSKLGASISDTANTGGIVTSQGIQHFAAGGVVPGIGTQDTVPAMLTPGEVVFNPARGQFPSSNIEVNFNNVNVRNDNDLQTILRAVKDTLTRESQAQKIGAL